MSQKSDRDAVILSGARTPIGKFLGVLAGVPAPRLGAVAVKAAVERAGIKPEEIEEVIMGQVVAAGSGQSPARQAGIFAGLPASVGAYSVNKACGSGMKAVMSAAQAIRANDADLFVAGGHENMSALPHLIFARQGIKYGDQPMFDSAQHDGLMDPFVHWLMGDAAEFIASEYKVTREAMDKLAFESHQKAIAAMEAGKFKNEIAPVEIEAKGKKTVIDTDECPRRDTSMEVLAKLKPAFQKDGRVTAGNAPGLNDGGAAVVVASRAKAEQMGKQPLAKIVGYTSYAVDPKYLFIAPAFAMPKLLDRIGWTFKDVDLVEINEAFAAQVLADGYALTEKGWDWNKVNVNGGAVALGHPVGASGARVLVTLMNALRQRGEKRGIATLCLGGGEAVAMAIEME